MQWTFRDDAPIYLQLIEQIKLKIVSGDFIPGEKLPAVREFAAQAGVNPNTMQRAMADLELAGLVYSVRTSGRFVTDDVASITRARDELARERVGMFIKTMTELGYSAGEIIELINKEGEKHGNT